MLDAATGQTVFETPADRKPKTCMIDPALAGDQLLIGVPGGGLAFAPFSREPKPGPPQILPFSLNPPLCAGDCIYYAGLDTLICIGTR